MILFDCEAQDRQLMIMHLQSITYFLSKVAGQTKILYVAYELIVIHFMVSQYVSYKVVVEGCMSHPFLFSEIQARFYRICIAVLLLDIPQYHIKNQHNPRGFRER